MMVQTLKQMLYTTFHSIYMALAIDTMIGMALVTKHIVSSCQCKRDKDDTALAVYFVRRDISIARQGEALRL